MKNLFIINEFASGEGRVLTGKDLDEDFLYHLEPLTIRRGGSGHQRLRNGLEERQMVAENENLTGILTVCGPYSQERELYIGWKERNGQSVWTGFHPIGEGEAIRKFFRDVTPLIAAYRVYHRKGFVVGAPVWERIYLDSQGYYFPDPAFLTYIQKLNSKIPTGLTRCRPPESYRGHSPGPAGDIFYLGVFVYFTLTGEIPFPLVNGWPTQALVEGDNIPIRIKRPDLNRDTTELIDRMVNQYPECRPTAAQLAEKWHDIMEHRFISSSGKDYRLNIREKKAYSRKQWMKWMKTLVKNRCNGRKPAIMLLIIGLSLALLWFGFINPPLDSPVEFAKRFYAEASNPASVISRNEVNIFPDIVKEREERIKAARNIVAQPLFELIGIRVVRRSGAVVVVEAVVKCWRLTETGWEKNVGRERLELRKRGRQWKIMKRDKI